MDGWMDEIRELPKDACNRWLRGYRSPKLSKSDGNFQYSENGRVNVLVMLIVTDGQPSRQFQPLTSTSHGQWTGQYPNDDNTVEGGLSFLYSISFRRHSHMLVL